MKKLHLNSLLVLSSSLSLFSFSCTKKKEEVIDDVKKVVTIYATNDFHGSIMENGNQMGLKKWGSFLKERSNERNTLLIDQGDTWQGSIYSNYNHGALITDVMNCIQFDARTVGNHDFDWGVDYLIANGQREYDGYTTPTLAANVFDYNFLNKTTGTTQQSNIGKKSVTYTLENGLKVGIVGVIGKEQITSITSSYVQDIAFTDHIHAIKQEAKQLREEGCDIVIASCHASQDDLLGNSLYDYVDLVLCGHSHRSENAREGRLNYAQFGSYGNYIGKIELEYNTETNIVTKTKITSLDSNYVSTELNMVDSTIASIVDTYNQECDEEANVVVANNVSGYFASSASGGDNVATMSNVMCKAIYDYSKQEGYDVDLATVNQARSYISSNQWTYSDIYRSFPFDNQVYIAEITGEEMINEVATYNYVYKSPDF